MSDNLLSVVGFIFSCLEHLRQDNIGPGVKLFWSAHAILDLGLGVQGETLVL